MSFVVCVTMTIVVTRRDANHVYVLVKILIFMLIS